MSRPGFAGSSNSQIGWSHHEQDDEQIQPQGTRDGGADAIGARTGVPVALSGGGFYYRQDWQLGARVDRMGETGVY